MRVAHDTVQRGDPTFAIANEMRRLRDEVDALKRENRELRGRLVGGRRLAVVERFGIAGQCGKLLAALSAANGRVVETEFLAVAGGFDYLPNDGRDQVKVLVCQLRRKLRGAAGGDPIKGLFGVGYALSPCGLALVREMEQAAPQASGGDSCLA
jgi:hypothetical protein